MNDRNNTTDEGLNPSLAEIRAAFELYYPHLPIRHTLLRLLVNTIRSVHNQANGPWRWTVTSPRPGKALINLNTSINSATSLLPIQVRSDSVVFLVEGPLGNKIEDHIRAGGGEITIPETYAHYSMANPQEVAMPASQIAALYPLIETCHRRMTIKHGNVSLNAKAPARIGYAPSILDYLREELPDLDIPDPGYYVGLFSSVEDSCTSANDAQPPESLLSDGVKGRSSSDDEEMSGPTGQGYITDAKKRVAVELHAMKEVEDHLLQMWPIVDDVSKDGLHYDLHCVCGDEELHVEVKGTTGAGTTVILTHPEVTHAREHCTDAALYVVCNIRVTPTADGEGYECSGGDIRGPWHPWFPDDADLQATEYRYTLPALS